MNDLIDFPYPSVTQEQAETSLNWFWLEHFENKRDQAKTKRERAYWEGKIEALQFQGIDEAIDATL